MQTSQYLVTRNQSPPNGCHAENCCYERQGINLPYSDTTCRIWGICYIALPYFPPLFSLKSTDSPPPYSATSRNIQCLHKQAFARACCLPCIFLSRHKIKKIIEDRCIQFLSATSFFRLSAGPINKTYFQIGQRFTPAASKY